MGCSKCCMIVSLSPAVQIPLSAAGNLREKRPVVVYGDSWERSRELEWIAGNGGGGEEEEGDE